MATGYYIAIIVYKSSSDSTTYTPMFEECITLIKATDEADARSKSEHLARSRETTFQNQQGDQIKWGLHKIIDVNPMLKDEISEVTELYARHFSDIDAYNTFETLST